MKKIAADADSLRVRFENFWGGFPIYDNIITVALNMKYNVEVVNDNPDIIVHQGPTQSKHPFWSTQINWNGTTAHDLNRGPTYYISLDDLDNRYISDRDRLCCSVASGTLGKRAEFYPYISSRMDVSHGGDFLRNTIEMVEKPGNSDYLEKIEFISKFKSNLCFENDDRQGYVCEKILHSFYAGCLPIYWGPKNVGEDFNKEAFIDISDFASDEEAVDYIYEVLSDKSKLLSYLEQPVFTDGQVPYHATPESLLDFFTGKILA